MRKFIDTADSRKTSPEIMEAIEFLANGNDELAGRIWAEPTYTRARHKKRTHRRKRSVLGRGV
jgi:hypothetical protein